MKETLPTSRAPMALTLLLLVPTQQDPRAQPLAVSVGHENTSGASGTAAVAPGMYTELEVKVLYGTLLEVTMSRRQLHEAERRTGDRRQRRSSVSRDAASARASARSCGMEALDEPQHRTKVKLRKAFGVWVSVPANATPDIQTRPRGIGDGRGGTLCVLTQGDLYESTWCGRRGGGNDDPPMPVEKSDHPVVVLKPGNAGGAKGVTE